jgi:hypothetical protein
MDFLGGGGAFELLKLKKKKKRWTDTTDEMRIKRFLFMS